MTDARTLTLTEFLIARIAEDEAHADEIHNCLDDDPLDLRAFGACTCGRPRRVLAECEAKRRIVEGIVPERDPYAVHPDYDPLWILRDLARVYADHPDYRDEWAL